MDISEMKIIIALMPVILFKWQQLLLII